MSFLLLYFPHFAEASATDDVFECKVRFADLYNGTQVSQQSSRKSRKRGNILRVLFKELSQIFGKKVKLTFDVVLLVLRFELTISHD